MEYSKENWIEYIRNNNINALKYLLDNNLIDINIQDKLGNTALIYTSYYDIKIVKLLSYKNICVNYQNKFGTTALIFATVFNHIKIVKLLLKHPDINIFIKDNCGKTALDYAKERKYKKIEALLIIYNRIEKLNKII